MGSAARIEFWPTTGWNQKRVLKLAPVNWEKTLEDSDAQQRLDANIFRQVSLGAMDSHRH